LGLIAVDWGLQSILGTGKNSVFFFSFSTAKFATLLTIDAYALNM
jgi:hypothetical protein